MGEMKKLYYLFMRLFGKRRAVIHLANGEDVIVIPSKHMMVLLYEVSWLHLEENGKVSDWTMMYQGIPHYNKVPGVTWEWVK
jgi:hypothetical protein